VAVGREGPATRTAAYQMFDTLLREHGSIGPDHELDEFVLLEWDAAKLLPGYDGYRHRLADFASRLSPERSHDLLGY
jgi:hypothetical protein